VDSISLRHSLLEETQDITDLPGLTRSYVHKARATLFEKHRAGAGGLEIVAAYSTMMDELICHLFGAISKDFLRRYPTGNPQCAIIAQGGYGRSELNPHSDIDLLFIYSWKVSAFVEAVTEKLLYTLWDAGLQVGHAIRSISESMRLAGTDMKVRTALLDSRYVCGDLSLYNEFEKAVQSRLARKRVNGFVGEKLAENHARHAGYGGSVYLLEPDVKESEGGLRDIHTARWMARVKAQVRDLDELAAKGIISAADIAKLKGSHDFLLRVRNELHFSTGKHQDQLTFEEQEKVSRALGFQGEGSLKAVEVCMSHYYRHASEISRLTALITHRLTDGGWPLLGGMVGLGRNIRDGVRISRDHITISKPEILTPSRIFRPKPTIPPRSGQPPSVNR